MNNKAKYFTPALIWAIAFAVRAIYVFEIRANDPTFAYPLLDGKWHLQWAMGIVAGDFWGKGVFFRAPLYPYFLALLIKLYGPSFLAIKLTQAAIGATTAVLVYFLGSRIAGSRGGIVAGIVAAFYAPLIYLDGELLIETIYMPLLCGGLLAAARALEKDSRRQWILSGFLFGMAAIARPNVLVFAPVLMAWIAFEKKWKTFVVPAILWAIAFAVPVAAVTIRNGVVGGEYVVIASQGGINFYIGNNPESDGKTATAPAHFPQAGTRSLYRDSVDVAAEAVAEKELGRELTAGEVSAYWFDKSFQFIKNNPGAWIKLTLKKCYFFLNGYEIPSNREMYRVRDWATVLRILLFKDPLPLPLGLIMPLAFAGAVLMIVGRKRYSIESLSAARLLGLFIVVCAATVIGFFVTARHRAPSIPMIVPFAALAIIEAYDLARKKSSANKNEIIVAAAVFVVMLGMSNSRFWGVRNDQTREYHLSLGDAFFRQGRYAESEAEIREAIRIEPTLPRAWFNLGVLCLQTKRYDEAIAAFETTTRYDPNYAPGWSQLGLTYLKKGDTDSAIGYFKHALTIDPKLAQAHYNLAQAYRKIGNIDGYLDELDFANQSDPYYTPANIEIAQLLMAEGRNDEARELLEKVIEVEPTNKRALDMLGQIGR